MDLEINEIDDFEAFSDGSITSIITYGFAAQPVEVEAFRPTVRSTVPLSSREAKPERSGHPLVSRGGPDQLFICEERRSGSISSDDAQLGFRRLPFGTGLLLRGRALDLADSMPLWALPWCIAWLEAMFQPCVCGRLVTIFPA